MKCTTALLALASLLELGTASRAADPTVDRPTVRELVSCSAIGDRGDRLTVNAEFLAFTNGTNGKFTMTSPPLVDLRDDQDHEIAPAPDLKEKLKWTGSAASLDGLFTFTGRDGRGGSFVIIHPEDARMMATFVATVPATADARGYTFAGRGGCRFRTRD